MICSYIEAFAFIVGARQCRDFGWSRTSKLEMVPLGISGGQENSGKEGDPLLLFDDLDVENAICNVYRGIL